MNEIVRLLNRIALALDNLTQQRLDADASLTRQEAAEFLRVSPRQLARYVRGGLREYPGPRYTRRDLIAFREDQRQTEKLIRTSVRAISTTGRDGNSRLFADDDSERSSHRTDRRPVLQRRFP